MHKASCRYPWGHLGHLKTCSFFRQNQNFGLQGVQGSWYGCRGQRCHLVPASIKGGSGVCVVKRCSMSFTIGSLILFSWDFLHTSAACGFCECENAFFFCWRVWSPWKTNGCATAAVLSLGFVLRGKKALSEIYFYHLISSSCWLVNAAVITISSSFLRSGVTH